MTTSEAEPARIGYFRNAFDDDSLVPMLRLQMAGCAIIHHDVGSGAKTPLPGLAMALQTISRGDTLVIDRLADFGRSVEHIVDVLQELLARDVRIECLTPAFTFDSRFSAADWVDCFRQAALALSQERGRQMRQKAASSGKRVGRPASITPELIARARALIASGHKVEEVAKMLNISRSGLYKHLADDDADG